MARKKKDPTQAPPGRTPKYIVNPEWSESKEAQDRLEDYLDNVGSIMDLDPNNPFVAIDCRRAERMSYKPEEYGLDIPEEGAWILVTKPPPAEYTVPPFSMWFAMPWPMKGHEDMPIHRVKVLTPRGNLGLFPHEYSKVRDISTYIGREKEGVEFKFFSGGEVGINQDTLFYIMSRGVKRREAMMMLLPTLKSPNVGWFEVEKAYADHFGIAWPETSRLATVPLAVKPADPSISTTPTDEKTPQPASG